MLDKYKPLLKVARDAIESRLNNKNLKISEDINKKFGVKQACFVTLTLNGELRGCIGSLYARQELWKDVVDNAINAGFSDYRFSALSIEELSRIKIEISVLSVPQKLIFKDSEDLLRKIDTKMGIILMKGNYSATFLPQVWEQIDSKERFLQQLSLKAGLPKDAWKNSEIMFYRVESVEE